MFYKYIVSENDEFREGSYPNVIRELQNINRDTARMSGSFKSDIAISFLKDHSLEIRWIDKNPKFVKFMTSRSLPTVHIEALFESSRGNAFFLAALEECIRRELGGRR
jgi:hypothetical protein